MRKFSTGLWVSFQAIQIEKFVHDAGKIVGKSPERSVYMRAKDLDAHSR